MCRAINEIYAFPRQHSNHSPPSNILSYSGLLSLMAPMPCLLKADTIYVRELLTFHTEH